MDPNLYWQQLGLRRPDMLTQKRVQQALAHFAYQYVAKTDKKIEKYSLFKIN